MSEAIRARALADVDELSDAALRTLSVAYRPLRADEDEQAGAALEQELVFVGTVGIIDPPRAEAAVAIQEAQRAGIRIIMITGDHRVTAAAIARELGLKGESHEGRELDGLNQCQSASNSFQVSASKFFQLLRLI
jgi:P-type E1-E2 ATPase